MRFARPPWFLPIALVALACGSDRVGADRGDASVDDASVDDASVDDASAAVDADGPAPLPTSSLDGPAAKPDAASADASASAGPDAASPDAAPDRAPDLPATLEASPPAPDAPVAADVAPDRPAPDAAVPADVAPDRPAPDAAVPADVAPDLAPDAAPDLAPDAAPDLAPDAAPDLAPDAAPDLAADASGADAGPSSARQTARPIGTTAAANGFYEYLPPGYGDGQLRPLMTFWHGFDQNGTGDAAYLPRLLTRGPPMLIATNQWPADRPFVVLSPQHAGDTCPPSDEIKNFITFALTHYQVDPKRVYFTGLSCGASGGWDYLSNNLGSQVVAAVLIAGVGNAAWTKAGCSLGEVAIWGFHGDADSVNPVSGTRDPLTALMACPMPPRRDARLTIYPGVGHDSWTQTYDLSAGHDIYTWMLGQSR